MARKVDTSPFNNTIRNNLWPVSIIGDGDPMNDTWWGNAWDGYEGFDLDGDGFGDKPYELYAYADRIWMDTPAAKFFRNSPVLELLDFLERLAPFLRSGSDPARYRATYQGATLTTPACLRSDHRPPRAKAGNTDRRRAPPWPIRTRHRRCYANG